MSIARRIQRVAESVDVIPYLPMDIIVRTPEEIRERLQMGDFFLAEVLEKGRALYDRSRRVG